jgi:hypothetical protein
MKPVVFTLYNSREDLQENRGGTAVGKATNPLEVVTLWAANAHQFERIKVTCGKTQYYNIHDLFIGPFGLKRCPGKKGKDGVNGFVRVDELLNNVRHR